MIVLEDLGFGQLGCFGSDVDTAPHLDGLAASELRVNRYVTAICSSTRACLLTGRNHLAVGMGFH
jgi:arylsulfatase